MSYLQEIGREVAAETAPKSPPCPGAPLDPETGKILGVWLGSATQRKGGQKWPPFSSAVRRPTSAPSSSLIGKKRLSAARKRNRFPLPSSCAITPIETKKRRLTPVMWSKRRGLRVSLL